VTSAHETIKQWREDPVKFVRDNFGVEPDLWQVDALTAQGGPANHKRRIVMKACTGPGKSAVLAWSGWHRLACFAAPGEHPKGAALSITGSNLKDNLWAELSKWQARSKFLSAAFTWTAEKIYANDHPSTWFLSARSFAADANPEAVGRALSGLHGKFPFVLLDETGDMPVAVGRAAMQIFTGSPIDAAIIQAGNPTSLNGLLYESCNSGLYEVITVTADPDDPKRTPRVSVEHAQEMISTSDGGRTNPWVMATILGLFPPGGFNSLLSYEEVKEAMNRHYVESDYEHAAKVLGVDVALYGDDSSVIFPRQGLVAFEPKQFRNVGPMTGAGYVGQKWLEWGADACFIDATGGFGDPWAAALEDIGRNPIRVLFNGPSISNRYANKRSEMFFNLAEWVRKGGALPPIPALIPELTTMTYGFKGDQLILEPKKEIKKRLGRSPDLADALALTFAQPVVPGYRGLYPQLEGRDHGRAIVDYDPIH
jgi:hypothetical protein